MSKMVTVDRVWKQYRLGGLRPGETFYDVLARTLRRQKGEEPRRDQATFWALRDVSFGVADGEVLGIIGHNGAGKSTLLKILTRISPPTRGRIELRGRIASLLEVGTGFHPELTGRENIFLNGAVLGMSRREIRRKFDEIVSFAEVERFLETPVKRYSSGMYVRLAFAVAAHLEPDILVVDEVLAVGDANFQRRCLTKMREVGGQGRSVMFVSHNLGAIQALCSRCICLDHGSIVASGPPRDVVTAYLQEGRAESEDRFWGDRDSAPGNDDVRIRSIAVRAAGGSADQLIDLDTAVELSFEYWNIRAGAFLNLSLVLVDAHGTAAFNTVPIRERHWHGKPFPEGLFRSICTIPPRLLNNGTYTVRLLVVRDQATIVYRDDHALSFTVHDVPEPGNAWHGQWEGTVRPLLDWQTEKLDENTPPGGSVTQQDERAVLARQSPKR